MSVFKREWVSGGKKQSAWYWDFQINGTRSRQRAANPDNPKQKARTKNEAEVFEAKAIQRVVNGEPIFKPKVKPWTFERFVEERFRPVAQETHRDYQNGAKWYLKTLLAEFGQKLIAEISPFEVEAFKKKQRERRKKNGKPLKPRTVNRLLEGLAAVFASAIAQGLRSDNPCESVVRLEFEPLQKSVLSFEDEERMLNLCRERRDTYGDWSAVEAAIVILVEGGFRPKEFFTMKKSQVDLLNRHVTAISYKRGRGRASGQPKRRQVPISDRALPYYRQLLDAPGDKLYPFKGMRSAWESLCKEAGVTGFWLRWLRDTAKHRWELAGFGPFEIAKLLGHASPQMTMEYSLVEIDRALSLMRTVTKTSQKAVEAGSAPAPKLRLIG